MLRIRLQRLLDGRHRRTRDGRWQVDVPAVEFHPLRLLVTRGQGEVLDDRQLEVPGREPEHGLRLAGVGDGRGVDDLAAFALAVGGWGRRRRGGLERRCQVGSRLRIQLNGLAGVALLNRREIVADEDRGTRAPFICTVLVVRVALVACVVVSCRSGGGGFGGSGTGVAAGAGGNGRFWAGRGAAGRAGFAG